MNWLSAADSSAQQGTLFRDCQEGTGQCFIDSQEFQLWHSGQKPTLFCPGIPGAGKTLLTSIAIHNLQKRFEHHANVGITYFYFNYKQQAEQSIESLLASLLKQLLLGQSCLPIEVQNLYERHIEKRTRPSEAELSDILNMSIRRFSRSFILLDALDECTDLQTRSKLLKRVFSLQNHQRVSVFATSRSIPEISAEFSGALSVEIRAIDDDVYRYVQSQMNALPYCVQKNKALQKIIIDEIVQAIDGM